MPTVVTHNQTAMRRAYPMEAETQRRTQRVISWIGILKKLMMTVIPWLDRKRGPLWYPYHGKGPLDEDDASSLTAWEQGYREVRNNLRDSFTGCGYCKPRDKPLHESRAKNYVREETTETRPKHPHTVPRPKARDHSTERVTGAELRKRTRCYRCRQLGHMARECQNPTIFSQDFLFARRCLCTIA